MKLGRPGSRDTQARADPKHEEDLRDRVLSLCHLPEGTSWSQVLFTLVPSLRQATRHPRTNNQIKQKP